MVNRQLRPGRCRVNWQTRWNRILLITGSWRKHWLIVSYNLRCLLTFNLGNDGFFASDLCINFIAHVLSAGFMYRLWSIVYPLFSAAVFGSHVKFLFQLQTSWLQPLFVCYFLLFPLEPADFWLAVGAELTHIVSRLPHVASQQALSLSCVGWMFWK